MADKPAEALLAPRKGHKKNAAPEPTPGRRAKNPGNQPFNRARAITMRWIWFVPS